MPQPIKNTIASALAGAGLAATGGLAKALKEGKGGFEVMDDVLPAAITGGLVGAYLGFTGSSSREGDKLANMGAALWHVGKAISASMVSLGVILPMQSCLTAAMIGMMTHLKGEALNADQILLVRTLCDGMAFDAAARPGGLLAGSVMALGALVEKVADQCGIPIRTPSSPMMPVMAPDIGGLCFGTLLGLRVASGVLYAYAHEGKAQPVTSSSAFNPDWQYLTSALAAGLGVMATITLTTLMHRESKFSVIPPAKPVDLLISRSNAIGDYPGASAYLVFGARAGLGSRGLLERSGASAQTVAAFSGLAFGGGIALLSQQYLVETTLNDRGAPGQGLEKLLGALRQDGKLEIPARTLEGRLVAPLKKRLDHMSGPGFTKHLKEIFRVGYQVMLTTLCVGLALKAAQHANFKVPDDDLERMLDADTVYKVAAGALAGILQMIGTPALQWLNGRDDPDARRAFAAWVGSAIAALDQIGQAFGAPSFLTTISLANATGAIVDEVIHRVSHRNDDKGSYLPLSDALSTFAMDEVGINTEIPGPFERFGSYFSLAWTGGLRQAQPAPGPHIEEVADDPEVAKDPIVEDEDGKQAAGPHQDKQRAPQDPDAIPLMPIIPGGIEEGGSSRDTQAS